MILKHRDKELLRFEWLEPQGVRVQILGFARCAGVHRYGAPRVAFTADPAALLDREYRKLVERSRNYKENLK